MATVVLPEVTTMEQLTVGVFAVGVVLGAGQLLGYVASALGWSDYWPVGDRTLWFYLHWGVSVGASLCLLTVAVLDYNAIGAPQPVTAAVGLALFLPSYVGGIIAGSDLGQDETMGLRGELRTDGWYRYSRNPQYVCYVLASAAFVLVAVSPLAGVLAGLHFAWWIVLPFAEEPWLRAEYGPAYEEYRQSVPRFVGWVTLRELFGWGNEGTERDRTQSGT